MAKGIPEEALNHIVQIPQHIKEMGESRSGSTPAIKLAATLKIMAKDQAYVYSESEFNKEFSDHKAYPTYLKKKLIQLGIKKPRIIKDDGKIYVFRNEE